MPGGCPCGRSHPRAGKWRWKAPAPVSTETFAERHYAALVAADGMLDYAGNCEQPRVLRKQCDRTHVKIKMRVACRTQCGPCLRKRMWYWALAGMEETRKATEAGNRSWFGTLTFRPEEHRIMLDDVKAEWMAENGQSTEVPEWLDDPMCDERFGLLREKVQHCISLYWARLRKKHKFRYLVCIERHKSGLPHVHFLLHEVSGPIRKRELQAQWAHGFSNVSIVGGKSSRAAAPDKAAWYVVKYLSKSVQSRQMASQGYRPPDRRQRSGKRSQSRVQQSGT